MKNKKDIRQSYCNPLPIPDIPWGKDLWYPYEEGMFSHENKPVSITEPDYRSISDPTVFYWDDKWYLYPSYGMAWVSENFRDWQSVSTEPYCPKYSPAIIPWKGKFLLTSWNCPLYVADTPTGPFQLLGRLIDTEGNEFKIVDPALFLDDDGRIYAYGFRARVSENFRFFYSQIIGWELDPDDPRQVIRGPVVLYEMNPKDNIWERFGAHHQNTQFGWVEGVHLLKHNGRYYAVYATPNTEYDNYCMAVLWSDDSPLDNFVVQKRNPLTIHQTGIVRGCGHGCVEHGPGGSLWAFYTVAVPFYSQVERRIGMDMVAVDENRELYCPFGVTDTPQFAPGYIKDPLKDGNDCGYLCLTDWCRATASSCAPGRDALYANDSSALSFWQPAADDPMPTLTCSLVYPYLCGAIRVFWREVGLDYKGGVRPGPVRYIVEGCSDKEQKDWFLLLDRSQSDTDYNIDYRVFEERECLYVRLKIVGKPEGLDIGLIDFTVFGRLDESK